MARPAKPIKLLVMEGKKHLGKAEIKRREAAEIHLGDRKLTCPAYVRRDLVAFAKWRELQKLFDGVEYVTSADIGHIARYCKLYSAWRDLEEHRAAVVRVEFSPDEEMEITEEFESHLGPRQAKRMWQKVEYIMSLDGIMAIDKAINSKAALLTQMEDRLYTNPLARVKSVPQKAKPKEADPLEQAGFGNV